ncbi:LysM peptidoglycan-binding domain-containing protein [Inquilinus limosus]|uniref:LysM domain-containing protein n=1 Tax=Inquilinus limosus MP06 TaxID=1398085 RepID=A0A0A0DD68_9PROT|nr:LysM peptidoglycan-binding domain-containing protein [Inquilinus limosus]KGM36079.1 hypothetical protein P409_00020 [Inquilinus limosus MP06]
MAIEVDKDGRMVKVENGVTTYVPTADQAQWAAAVKQAMQRNGITDASNLRFMVAEKGDSQWSMAQQIGSPWGEMVDFNRFKDDDLIDIGEVVVAPAPTPEAAAALGPKGRDAFAQSIESRSNEAANADSGTAGQKWDAVNGDIKTYLNSLSGDDFIQGAFDLIGYKDFTEDTAYTRTLVIDNVLGSLGNDKGAQQQMVDQLLAQKWPDNADAIKNDVTKAAQERGLKVG